MNKKKLFISVATLSLLALPLVASAAGGLQSVTPFAGTATGGLVPALRTLVNTLLTVVGVIAAIFIVIGGVRYIFSQGDDDAQVQARNTIIYALVGLFVIIISGVLVNLVLSAF